MKKLIFAAAVAAGMGAFALESANVVGYTSKNVSNGSFYILGVQFEHTDGSMNIDGLINGTEGVAWDEPGAWKSTASQIQVPNAAGTALTTYYYLNDGWYNNGTTEGGYKPGWCNVGGEIVTDAEFTPGVAVWFKSMTGDCAAQVSGQVPKDSSVSVQCQAGIFSLKANAYPKAFGLNDSTAVEYVGIMGVAWDEPGAWKTSAPQIQVPNVAGTALTTYYYLNDGWYDNGTTDGGYKPGWCNIGGEIVDVEVPAGQGFWVKASTGAFNISFKN